MMQKYKKLGFVCLFTGFTVVVAFTQLYHTAKDLPVRQYSSKLRSKFSVASDSEINHAHQTVNRNQVILETPPAACNCSKGEKDSHALGKDRPNVPCKHQSRFKNRGVVFDCVSGRSLKLYNADELERATKLVRESVAQSEDAAARKLSFSEIFKNQVWGGKETGERNRMSENFQASGPGSSLMNTQGAAALLHSVIEKLKLDLNKDTISIADIPCGDMQWISHFLKTRTDVNYTGVDIVPELIQRHDRTYRHHKNINFINTDVVQSPLTQPFDIIFSRQMMQHFPNADIQRVLYHFSSSGSKYMIATTYSDIPSNTELTSTAGVRYRRVDLEKQPFNLVPPTCSYQETQQMDNYLGMWELPLKVMQ